MNTSYIKIGRILSILLILAFIATSIFIFSNSLKSRSSSANDSDSVTNAIKPFVDPDGKVVLYVGGHQPDSVSNALLGDVCKTIEL